jgi:putative transposase
MSFVKIMIHAVWGTKNREHQLTPPVKRELVSHIKKNAFRKNIRIKEINGHLDHLHCLFELDPEMPIDNVMQFLKGESSFWANKVKLTTTKLEWADGYYAVSVSESVVDSVAAYILNQEEHHKHVSFTKEYDGFLRRYGK